MAGLLLADARSHLPRLGSQSRRDRNGSVARADARRNGGRDGDPLSAETIVTHKPQSPHPALLGAAHTDLSDYRGLDGRTQRPIPRRAEERKSVVQGKGVPVRVILGGCRTLKKKTNNIKTTV